MFPFKVLANIDGTDHEVEVKQVDPLHAHYEVIKEGKGIGRMRKTNDLWSADEDSCLLPDDVLAIGKAIDEKLENEY